MENKDFHIWLNQFVKELGHSFGVGVYVELNTGETLIQGTPEYAEWYSEKLEEYKNK